MTGDGRGAQVKGQKANVKSQNGGPRRGRCQQDGRAERPSCQFAGCSWQSAREARETPSSKSQIPNKPQCSNDPNRKLVACRCASSFGVRERGAPAFRRLGFSVCLCSACGARPRRGRDHGFSFTFTFALTLACRTGFPDFSQLTSETFRSRPRLRIINRARLRAWDPRVRMTSLSRSA